MSAVLLSPHHDDETLFAAFTCLREKPHVIVVLRSVLQQARGNGVTDSMRQQETACACAELGCTVEFWPYSDADPDWEAIKKRVDELAREADHLYVPAAETEGGHPHHDALAAIVNDLYLQLPVTHYLTYTNGRQRSTWGRPVPVEPGWISAKFRALACYESQIKLWPHHFLDYGQREFYA